MREAVIKRQTTETKIELALSLEGGKYEIVTGCGFLDHMLELFAKHSGFGLKVSCEGDTRVDYHHTTEDIGIALGETLKAALGDKRGIRRYGDIILPMDEALALCAVDLSGRGYLGWSAEMPSEKVGDFDSELAKEFWLSLTRSGGVTAHVRLLAGENTHHIIEAIFKGLARALAEAAAIDSARSGERPSSKGAL